MGFYETLLSKKLNKAENLNAPLYDMLLAKKLSEGGGGVEKTVTGKTITITDALAEPMKLADIAIVFAQSGGYTEANMYLYGGKNLFDKSAKDTSNGYLSGRYANATGGSNGNASWNVSEYIPIKGGEAYTLSGLTTASNPAYCLYDQSKTFISGTAYSNQTTKKFTAPSNACYIRFSIPKANVDVVQLEIGSSATTYEAFTSGTVYPINWQSEAGTVYSGHVDLISGLLTVDATPTPQTYQLTPQEISTLEGTNVIWSDANGDTTITYLAKE